MSKTYTTRTEAVEAAREMAVVTESFGFEMAPTIGVYYYPEGTELAGRYEVKEGEIVGTYVTGELIGTAHRGEYTELVRG